MSRPNEPDPRVAAARAELAALGLAQATLDVAGHDRSVALLRLPDASLELLGGQAARAVAERLRGVGFRYVALELDAAG